MNSQVNKAVLNNIAWCVMVCDTHRINHYSKENLWGLLREAPTYYPEVITASRSASSDEVKYFIENGEVTSIKDSYANLDMVPFGFNILFEAEWIYHPSVSEIDSSQTNWRMILTENDLAQWTLHSELVDVIKPELLKYKNVKVFIHEDSDGISGFIANASADVVGVSNVFTVGNENENLWREIPKIISAEFPGLSMVGYEHGSNLNLAQLSGWKSLGPLRVWIKSK